MSPNWHFSLGYCGLKQGFALSILYYAFDYHSLNCINFSLSIVAYFFSHSCIKLLNLTTQKMNVLSLVEIKRPRLMCMLVWARVSTVCVFVWQGTRTLQPWFMVLHENKCSLSDFNYKGENVKVPRSLASFCSVSGGSGFGVFNVWLLS